MTGQQYGQIRERRTSLALHDGTVLPQGWAMELADTKDSIDAYETMTRVAQTA
jgi:hypothetical protein